ncbi:MAG: hypothetical protein EBV24_01835 [Actinobacteria bacterium]|nr:hypothetical protein [Actinomycetota bacterium]
MTATESFFTIPTFSRAMSRTVGPAYSVWSSAMLVMTHRHVDRCIGKAPKRRGRENFKERRSNPGQALGIGHCSDVLGEGFVIDGCSVDEDPLVDPLEMGTGVCADPQPVGHQQLGDDLGRRALAIRPRDVNHPVVALGLTHDRRERQGTPTPRRSSCDSAATTPRDAGAASASSRA